MLHCEDLECGGPYVGDMINGRSISLRLPYLELDTFTEDPVDYADQFSPHKDLKLHYEISRIRQAYLLPVL